MCPNCRAFITTSDKVCPYCEVRLGPRAIDRRTPADALGGLIPHAQFLTVVILLINAGMYLATVAYSYKTTGSFDLSGLTLHLFGAKDPYILLDGQWWRLITAGFLHGGIFHILMNSWVLFDVGVQVEEVFGVSRYLVIYFVGNVLGYLVSLYWAPGGLSIGASAAIMGLIGAMIAYGVHDRSAHAAAMRKMYLRWVVYILLFGLLPFFAIDNAAHIGGLIGGFAIGYVAGTPGFKEGVERFWQLASWAVLAVTVIAFVDMFRFLLSSRGI
jgi:rhomboid protease GluP